MAEEKKTRQTDGGQGKKREAGASMIAPHPLAEQSFADLAKKNNIGPFAAGLKRAKGWEDNTMLTEREFNKSLGELKSKPLGARHRRF